jgi:hypothetical protein
MTVAPLKLRKLWWQYTIPESWISIEGVDPRERQERQSRDFNRDRDELEDTRSFRNNRRYDDSPPLSPKIQVPFGVIITIMIYLIGQLVGGVWWAATLQSNLQHEIADRAKEESRLWDSVQTYRLEVQALRVEIARSAPKSSSRQRITEEE